MSIISINSKIHCFWKVFKFRFVTKKNVLSALCYIQKFAKCGLCPLMSYFTIMINGRCNKCSEGRFANKLTDITDGLTK